MRTKLAAAAVAASFIATAAGAQTTSFGPGAPSPSSGFTVVNTFNTNAGLTGSNFQIKTPPADGSGAPPANSVPAGTSYLSVLGAGFATYSLASLLPHAIQFDWGSIDAYNTLTIKTVGNQTFTYIPGTVVGPTPFPNAADGNQSAPGTNGLFTFTLNNMADRISSVTFASSANSFEVDNFAVSGAVPEPASWALMIGGFGLAGVAMRRRRKTTGAAFA